MNDIPVKILFNIYGFTGGSFDGCCYDIRYLGPCLKARPHAPRIFEFENDKKNIYNKSSRNS